jgi:hypothetical protein
LEPAVNKILATVWPGMKWHPLAHTPFENAGFEITNQTIDFKIAESKKTNQAIDPSSSPSPTPPASAKSSPKRKRKG